MAPANIINHIVLVLDASSSMQGSNAQSLIKVADNQITYLAQRSKELDQETRVTVYQFGSEGNDSTYRSYGSRPPSKIECLVYDKDVLRVPSISQVYHAWGNTPLIDATVLALDDLAMTPEKYGEHSFLVYVLTDGKENDSSVGAPALANRIARLPDHWTLAAFVPDQIGVHEAKRFGFPAQNIAVWDTNSHIGLEKAGEVMREATESFMQARRNGVRGSRSLFRLSTPSIAEVKSNLTALKSREYDIYNVGTTPARIDEFVAEATGESYRKGSAYYQLSKTEEIQPQKQIAIMGSKGVYTGTAARSLLGLPNDYTKVTPTNHPDYDIFVQSTSVNRKLMPHTKVLVLA